MKDIKKQLQELTIEEKAALLEGHDFWKTNSVSRLGIPSLFLTDGPHGLRKTLTEKAKEFFGLSDNGYSTAFPTSATLASSWNIENAYKMGQAIAKECVNSGVHVLLAPGINIKRSPLCGRNFEYYSEDPLISGAFGESFVKGVQSEGVGCCLKHFAANSNENFRFNGNSVVDERALREIYLRAFEYVIKKTPPYTLMCSYNQINGTYSSENKELLTDILRKEWNYDGLVMTDWGGSTCNRAKGILAGCDLDMPGEVWYNRKTIIDSASSGNLPLESLNKSVERVLWLIEKTRQNEKDIKINLEEHALLSCEIAKDCAVLLKNDGVLPLKGNEKILVAGEMFEKMRYQGAGSSLIKPPKVISPRQAFEDADISYSYINEHDAVAKSNEEEEKEVILYFGGLSDFEESEGFDRKDMKLSEDQIRLINSLIRTNKKVVFILFAGAPVELPFFEGVSAILNMYLPGMYGGKAVVDLLFGNANPSGKLTESWPFNSEKTSCHLDFDKSRIARYYESIYVGYRFYDKSKTPLRFPFGFGLSYTTFSYRDMSAKEIGDKIDITLKITNTGKYDGSEVVQIYAKSIDSSVFKPLKELVAFKKLFLKSGETKEIIISFDVSSLSYWNVKFKTWVLENGSYEICAASSCTKIEQSIFINVNTGLTLPSPYPPEVEKAYNMPASISIENFNLLIGDISKNHGHLDNKKTINMYSTLSEFSKTAVGRIFYMKIMYKIKKEYRRVKKMPDSDQKETKLKNTWFMHKMMPSNTIQSMVMSSGGKFSYKTAKGLIYLSNGKLIKGIKELLKKEKILLLPDEK